MAVSAFGGGGGGGEDFPILYYFAAFGSLFDECREDAMPGCCEQHGGCPALLLRLEIMCAGISGKWDYIICSRWPHVRGVIIRGWRTGVPQRACWVVDVTHGKTTLHQQPCARC
jgi:hypothetical protein